jgi:AcrR family transcriptional regulator
MAAMNDVQEENERRSDEGGAPSRAASRRRDLRDTLLAAAERAIAQGGLHDLKARELAREAGCALGAVYTAFADLDALILAVNARTLDALKAELLATVRPSAGPVQQITALADAYLDYAARHRPRWTALFEHRMTGGRTPPDWYLERQAGLFRHVEAPLAALRPELDAEELARLARTLFSAVHGMVSLGLDEKLGSMPEAVLRRHLHLLTGIIAQGLEERA